MAKGADFVLKLIDRITAPARAMRRSLGGLNAAQQAVKATSAATQAGIASVGNAATKAAAQVSSLAKSYGRIKTLAYTSSMAQLTSLPGAAHGPAFDPKRAGLRSPFLKLTNMFGGGGKAVQGMMDWNKATGEALEKWGELRAAFMKTPFGMIASGIASVAKGLFDLVTEIWSAIAKAGALGLALGAVAAISFAKSTVEMAGFGEASKQAFGYLLGDKALGGPALKYAIKTAKEFGIAAKDAVSQFLMLRSKQFSIRESKELIALSTDLKTVTGDAQAAERALVAISQIKAKTKLQSEELVGQLAEAGVPVELVYQNLEKTLNTNRAGVMKALQGGQVNADVGIDAIKKAIKQNLGIEQAGQLGKDFANNTLLGLMQQLENAPDNFKLDLLDFIDIEPSKEAIRQILKAFDGIDRGTVGSFVNEIIKGFAKMTPVVLEFARGFGDSFGSIIDALTFGEKDVMKEARAAGRWLAEFFAEAIKLSEKLMTAVMPAIKGFMEGLDLNGVMEDLSAADFEALGRNLADIAKALGSITMSAGKLAVWLVGDNQGSTADKVVSANPFKKTSAEIESFDKMAPGWDKLMATFNPWWHPSDVQPAKRQEASRTNVVDVKIDARGAEPWQVKDATKRGVTEALYSAENSSFMP